MAVRVGPLVACPTCNGAGQQNVTVSERGQPTREYTICCVICNGQGAISKKEKEAYDRHMADWCGCDNPSGTTRYYDDNEHPDCRKHHYRCGDCGGIQQIG